MQISEKSSKLFISDCCCVAFLVHAMHNIIFYRMIMTNDDLLTFRSGLKSIWFEITYRYRHNLQQNDMHLLGFSLMSAFIALFMVVQKKINEKRLRKILLRERTSYLNRQVELSICLNELSEKSHEYVNHIIIITPRIVFLRCNDIVKKKVLWTKTQFIHWRIHNKQSKRVDMMHFFLSLQDDNDDDGNDMNGGSLLFYSHHITQQSVFFPLLALIVVVCGRQ